MKILITGGAGFIGSNLTRYYLENTDHEITVVDRDEKNAGRLKDLCKDLRRFELILDDYHDVDHKVICNELDAVVHLASVPRVAFSVEHPEETTYENIFKTVSLLHRLTDVLDVRFVFASSSSVYGGATLSAETEQLNPKSPYALQKKCGEEFCSLFSSLYGLDTVCLRFFNVFGEHQYADGSHPPVIAKWCDQLKKGEPLLLEGDGTQSRDFTHVDNVVHGINLAVTNERGLYRSGKKFSGDIYNIANEERTSLNQLLRLLSDRFDNIELDRQDSRVGDVQHSQANIQKATEELNYKPVCRLGEGLEKTLEWWGIKAGVTT